MGPVVIRHDPDRRLRPAEGSVEARSQNPKGLPVVPIVRTDPFLTSGSLADAVDSSTAEAIYRVRPTDRPYR